MIIGIPKEIMPGENRAGATPETVRQYRQAGYAVLVEKGAGTGSFISDSEYAQAGADIAADARKVYAEADLIIKVKEPRFNQAFNLDETEMMHEGQVLLAFIHPAAPANHKMVRNLAAKGVTSLTLDSIPRSSKTIKMDPLVSMSICAGYKGLLLAAGELKSFVPAVDTAAGSREPANVMIIGAGVAGRQAIKTAVGLGANVHAVDIRLEALEKAEELGAVALDLLQKVRTPGKNPDLGDESLLAVMRQGLLEYIGRMDIIICSVLILGCRAPLVLTAEMVRKMKPGSVIVDISIDQGGNCELTEAGKIVVKEDITIIGIKNIPGMIPSSSTDLFARNVREFVNYLSASGRLVIDSNDEIIDSMLTTTRGKVVHKPALAAMGNEVKDNES